MALYLKSKEKNIVGLAKQLKMMVMEEAEITRYSCPFFCHPRDDDSDRAVNSEQLALKCIKGHLYSALENHCP